MLKLTASPDSVVAVTGNGGSPNVLSLSGSNVIVWVARAALTAANGDSDSARPQSSPGDDPGSGMSPSHSLFSKCASRLVSS